MKIIKRSGAEVTFDPHKIVVAVTKANESVVPSARMTPIQIKRIAEDVESAAMNMNRSLSVEEIQDMVCENTKLYTCNAARFKSIVEGVEAKNVPPQRIAVKCEKILLSRRVRFAYSLNRNPLLLILNALPKRLQLWAIRKILKKQSIL